MVGNLFLLNEMPGAFYLGLFCVMIKTETQILIIIEVSIIRVKFFIPNIDIRVELYVYLAQREEIKSGSGYPTLDRSTKWRKGHANQSY